MSDFANMFAAGAVPILVGTFGCPGRIEILPGEGDLLAVEGIVFPEEKRTETIKGMKQIIRERAVQIPQCPVKVSEALQANTRCRIHLDGAAYHVHAMTLSDVGILDLTLRREETATIGNPFRK